jgi:hypothetical protein
MPDKPRQPELLKSWKEIANYMNSGVRTVQRYERMFGLPVRRPAGKLHGSVMATRAEIDAWVAATPIRKTFKLSRTQLDPRMQAQADRLEKGMNAMRKLKDQMLALRAETRSSLKLLIDRVSTIRLHMPPTIPEGYKPFVDMDMDMDMDMEKRFRAAAEESAQLEGVEPPRSPVKSPRNGRTKISASVAKKLH